MPSQKPQSPTNDASPPVASLFSKLRHLTQLQNVRKLERTVFKYGNTLLMVPLLQSGFARFIGSPPTGYFLLLQTTGRKTYQPRFTPLNYVIDNGGVICLAGFGEQAHWLANIRSDPHVHVQLPARALRGVASEINDQAEARRLAVQVARHCGFALIFEHPRCLFMSDVELAQQLDGRPVVRIEPVDGPVVAGPYDPGGRGWVVPMLVKALALLGGIALWRYQRRKRRTATSSEG